MTYMMQIQTVLADHQPSFRTSCSGLALVMVSEACEDIPILPLKVFGDPLKKAFLRLNNYIKKSI